MTEKPLNHLQITYNTIEPLATHWQNHWTTYKSLTTVTSTSSHGRPSNWQHWLDRYKEIWLQHDRGLEWPKYTFVVIWHIANITSEYFTTIHRLELVLYHLRDRIQDGVRCTLIIKYTKRKCLILPRLHKNTLIFKLVTIQLPPIGQNHCYLFR